MSATEPLTRPAPATKGPEIVHAICPVCFPDQNNSVSTALCGKTAQFAPGTYRPGDLKCVVCRELLPAHYQRHRGY